MKILIKKMKQNITPKLKDKLKQVNIIIIIIIKKKFKLFFIKLNKYNY